MSAVRIDSLPSLLAGTLYFGGSADCCRCRGRSCRRPTSPPATSYFRPALLFVGSTSFDFSVRDTNGPAFDVVPNTMTVNVAVPTNDPVNVVPAAQVVNEDTPTALAGISVNDPNGDLDSGRS